VALLILIPFSPKTMNNVVIARKWFHLVAVVLFAPVTRFAPQLMSLSYTVALAVLMVLENLRFELDWPQLRNFYACYLDSSKDQSQDRLVISHIALIFGCAAPLWISQIVEQQQRYDDADGEHKLPTFLPYWGILVLGVGDSMGALVGTYFGKMRWSIHSRRTVEGSVAMWCSMATLCWLFLRPKVSGDWLVATTFVTLLEAFTHQIDNLVLPLAGTAVVLLLADGRNE
jgi:dolichol kinase